MYPVQPSSSGVSSSARPYLGATLAASLPARRAPYATADLKIDSSTQRELLYRELQPLLSSMIGRYGSDPELRQELPGEFYCRFHALYQSYDERRGIPIRAYMVRCLTVGMYTWARSYWRRKRRELCMTPPTEPPSESSADPAAELQAATHREQVVSALRAAVERLSPRQREVLIARYYCGRSFEEISLSVGICPATVRSLVRHAIHNLRRQLETQNLLSD